MKTFFEVPFPVSLLVLVRGVLTPALGVMTHGAIERGGNPEIDSGGINSVLKKGCNAPCRVLSEVSIRHR